MRVGIRLRRQLLHVAVLVCAGVLSACGGGSGPLPNAPVISIDAPTAAATYPTTSTDVRLGGSIGNAAFVRAHNAATGVSADGLVVYNLGQGTWLADIQGLGFGDNRITVTADADGTGTRTATAEITVIRPLQPADLVFNAPNASSATSHWVDQHSIGVSHRIAIHADGTGRATTGSVLAETAGAAMDFTWSKLGPDAILVSNCAACSFQKITRISGSLGESAFHGQVETVGGAGEPALHVFTLAPGVL